MYKFIDLHCDTITTANEKNEKFLKNNLHIDLERLSKFKQPTQVFAIWLNKKFYKNAFERTNKMIDFFEKEINTNENLIKKATNLKEINANEINKKISAMLSIEGGESLENNIQNIEKFYKRGVRFLTFCWNYENNLGFGATTGSEKGIKDFGKEAIKEMNRLNMVIDVSHINERGFWDIYDLSQKPLIATHSNVYNLCNHKRNLKDEQIRAIGEKNGLIGINLYPKFLNINGTAKIYHILKHIEYIINLIGAENICLGGDFDGIENTPEKITNISEYIYLFEAIEKNFGKKIVDKILYKNFYNFIEKNLN